MSDQKLFIGYYRLSREDDNAGDSNSIINQRKLVKDYISHMSDLEEMSFQEFYDDGYSGSSMDRPGIKKVLALARENKVQCIIVKDFSRFARNYIEMGTYLEQIFPFLGVRFISISDHYDSRDYRGKSTDIADFYVKDQSVKLKSAFSTRRSKGEYCCGVAPYGYERNPENKKNLLIVEEEAKVVRRIFDLTIQRYSKMEICRILNEEKVPTPYQAISKRLNWKINEKSSRGMQWVNDSIRKILDDKTYIGCMVYGKTWIPDPGKGKEDHHKPIVSKEVFEKVQSMQIRHVSKSRYDRTSTVLTGYVKCGECKNRLTGSKEERGHVYYSCAYSRGKKDTGCFAGKVDNKILEQILLEKIKIYLQQNINQEQMQQAMKKQHEDNIAAYKEEYRDCQKKQDQMKNKSIQNYEAYRAGEITREQFGAAKKQLEEEKDILRKRIQEVEELIHNEKEILVKRNIPVEQMIEFMGYDKLTREMLEEYVEEILVYDDGKMEIKWKELK